LVAAKPRNDGDTLVGHEPGPDVAPLDAVVLAGDEDVAALFVGLDRALRKARRHDRTARDLGRSKTARPQSRIVRHRATGDALAVLLVDDRRNLPDLASEGLIAADRGDLSGPAHREHRKVVLVDDGQ